MVSMRRERGLGGWEGGERMVLYWEVGEKEVGAAGGLIR